MHLPGSMPGVVINAAINVAIKNLFKKLVWENIDVYKRQGISRGVFSNEAGLGTLAVLHGPAEHTTPWEQGMWAMFAVFFDTVVLCTLCLLYTSRCV